MAAPTIPQGGMTLHTSNNDPEGPASAILLRLSDAKLQEIRNAAQGKDGLHFVTGSTPVRDTEADGVGLTFSAELLT